MGQSGFEVRIEKTLFRFKTIVITVVT